MREINPSDFVPARRWAHVSGGETIRILRKKKGWTQKQLASRIGLSVKNLSLIENSRTDIGENLAGHLARAFKISVSVISKPSRTDRLK